MKWVVASVSLDVWMAVDLLIILDTLSAAICLQNQNLLWGSDRFYITRAYLLNNADKDKKWFCFHSGQPPELISIDNAIIVQLDI